MGVHLSRGRVISTFSARRTRGINRYCAKCFLVMSADLSFSGRGSPSRPHLKFILNALLFLNSLGNLKAQPFLQFLMTGSLPSQWRIRWMPNVRKVDIAIFECRREDAG